MDISTTCGYVEHLLATTIFSNVLLTYYVSCYHNVYTVHIN